MMEAAVRGACEGSDECGIDTPSVLAVTVLPGETLTVEAGAAPGEAGAAFEFRYARGSAVTERAGVWR